MARSFQSPRYRPRRGAAEVLLVVVVRRPSFRRLMDDDKALFRKC